MCSIIHPLPEHWIDSCISISPYWFRLLLEKVNQLLIFILPVILVLPQILVKYKHWPTDSHTISSFYNHGCSIIYNCQTVNCCGCSFILSFLPSFLLPFPPSSTIPPPSGLVPESHFNEEKKKNSYVFGK